MTPQRRNGFFLSLRQLELRLASESLHIKKPRLSGQRGLADANVIGLVDANTTSTDRLAEAGHVGPAGFGLADAESGLEGIKNAGLGVADGGSGGLDAEGGSANVDAIFLRDTKDNTHRPGSTDIRDSAHKRQYMTDTICSMDGEETIHRTHCKNEAICSRYVEDGNHRTQCKNDALSSDLTDGIMHKSEETICSGVLGDGLFRRSQSKNDAILNGIEDGIRCKSDTITLSGDAVHSSNVVYTTHDREGFKSVALCEDEGKLYDTIFSSDVGDSSSPLVFPAHWNPWETGQNMGGSESNPPAEFLATPTINNTLDMVDKDMTDPALKCSCEDLKEFGDSSHDLSSLCELLGLDVHAWHVDDKSSQENELLLSDHCISDQNAFKHEHPGSLFYSNVAKVGEEDCSQYAKALDSWAQQLLKSQTDPFCCALLLIAKASLQKDKGLSADSSLKFPCIVQEWLAGQHPDDH